MLDDFFKGMDATTTSRNLAYYADKLAIHPNHLNAAVKRATGKTAHELLHEHLLAIAKMLLSQTRLSAKEIAYQLAFKEPAHFANFFKNIRLPRRCSFASFPVNSL
ncbi:MAG: helix-turn-helix domain-containing protein [Hymenobacter sp.]